MAIYLGGETVAAKPVLDDLTPREHLVDPDKLGVEQRRLVLTVLFPQSNQIYQ